MPESYRVASVGATGAVGQKVLQILEERHFPIAELVPFASARSEGKTITFRGEQLACRVLSDDAIDGFDLVFSSAGGSVSREWAPKFAARGAIVIDKTSAFRMAPDVPLVVPEVNPDTAQEAIGGSGIVSSPNCSTMAMVVALNPIHRAVGIEEIIVSTYQSGRAPAQAINELLGRPTRSSTTPNRPRRASTPTRSPSTCSPGRDVRRRQRLHDRGAEDDGRDAQDPRRHRGGDRDHRHGARVPVINAHSESIRIRTRSRSRSRGPANCSPAPQA